MNGKPVCVKQWIAYHERWPSLTGPGWFVGGTRLHCVIERCNHTVTVKDLAQALCRRHLQVWVAGQRFPVSAVKARRIETKYGSVAEERRR